MTVNDLFVEKRPLRIGRRIGRGGEGDVFELQDDVASAIKIYTVTDLKPREEKVEAMVANGLASRSTLASFPDAVVRDRTGRFRGFKMKLVRDHKPLHELYAPGARKQFFPQADYRFLVRAAGNLARAVASVHTSSCVIGDINHSGALFSSRATASLIDADSFQFSLGSRVFFCKVGVPEYTPPELQGQPLGSIVRTANHDCFGLAVIIFQLLFMGRHPFVGSVRKGDIPPLHEAIRDYRFVYTDGRNVGMDQPPGTPAVSDFPLDVGKYFEAAFGRQSRDQRPTASDWIRVLDTLESSLVPCAENKLHYYPRDSNECPWCFMEEQLGTVLFVPFVPGAKLVEGVDPGAAAFRIDAIWRQISALSIPPRERILPKIEWAGPAPKTPLLEKIFAKVTPGRLLCAAAALAVLILAPTLWFVSLGLAGYAVFGGRNSASDKVELLRKKLTEVDGRWFNAVLAWQKRAGVDELAQLQLQLQVARDEYISLEGAKRREIDGYKSQRREKQLHAFLENYQIRNSRIRGIGTAKQAALASYGIDTAADISTAKVLAVPGIGPAIADDLMKWKSSCEGRFRFSDTPNQSDAQ
jgi:DNA-binding helix-hairpin-helix protein with protein kinase domain